MATSYPHINVEEIFDELVREHGGAIVLREKIGKSPDFANADYVFHSEKVIAELKCLMDDNIDSPGTQAKLNSTIDKYHAEGKILTKEITEETWRGLPQELQNDIYTITTHSIRARINKANQQIRETKAKLGMDEYSGMLIIANDGLESIPPPAFVHAIARHLNNHCREIDLFIFLTANIYAKFEDQPMPAAVWFPMAMDKPAKIGETLINQLRISWQRMVCKKLGATPFDFQMKDEDMGAFWKARNLPKP